MEIILVRVGIDSKYGEWNAPIDLCSNDFLYIPIPESQNFKIKEELVRPYKELLPIIKDFYSKYKMKPNGKFKFPKTLLNKHMHLDPDFDNLTYGDNGARRGKNIASLDKGDMLIFYAGLKPIQNNIKFLSYSLIGLFVINKIVKAIDLPKSKHYINAHTRKVEISSNDIVVIGQTGKSGRFKKSIPVGEYRDRAYRVKRGILQKWGGLSIHDGYIQRSINPPYIKNPEGFFKWLNTQKLSLIQKNN